MTGLNTICDAPAQGASARIRQLTHHSSMRENYLMHLLLAQLGLELDARGVEYDELRSAVDREGFDVLLEAGGIARHIQVKAKVLGGARSEVTINTRLAAKPSGCVVWLTFDPVARDFSEIFWFGGQPGAPLPDAGTIVARHTRANSQGVKGERPGHRVVKARQFEQLGNIAHLVDRLFGCLPAAPLAFLRSRMLAAGSGPAWLDDVAAGYFGTIPADVSWEDGGAGLAALVDGYRLLELVSDVEPDAFLEQQRGGWSGTRRWAGDAVTLWITLFLELRADRFGANDGSDAHERLDTLVQQLRAALIDLESADA